MSDQKKDPRKEGWILTWGVMRENPVIFMGAFQTKEAAQARASTLGEGHRAIYATHLPGTDEFLEQNEPRD